MSSRLMEIVFGYFLEVCAICVGVGGWKLIFVFVLLRFVLMLVVYRFRESKAVCYSYLVVLFLRCTGLLVVYIFEMHGGRRFASF